MHLRVNLKFLGAILVHPVRRQNFAGTGAPQILQHLRLCRMEIDIMWVLYSYVSASCMYRGWVWVYGQKWARVVVRWCMARKPSYYCCDRSLTAELRRLTRAGPHIPLLPPPAAISQSFCLPAIVGRCAITPPPKELPSNCDFS